MAMPQSCYLAKGASHTTNTIKIDRIPFDLCNSIKRFDLCPFDQRNSTYLQPPTKRPCPRERQHEKIIASDLELLAVLKSKINSSKTQCMFVTNQRTHFPRQSLSIGSELGSKVVSKFWELLWITS